VSDAQTGRTIPAAAGGRGARGRILAAATKLFYEHGINATGMKQLTETAHVSTRTFYQHFASKDELISAYLQRWDSEHLLDSEAALDRLDLPPRDRLLGLFRTPPADAAARGCPFHNAAVEIADPDGPARTLITAHKQRFLEKISETANAAGADTPMQVAWQIAILHEGATSWWTSTGDRASFQHARRTAGLILDHATHEPRSGGSTVAGDDLASSPRPIQPPSPSAKAR
jgi:AcrR family transcriptional regulator